MAIKLKQLYTKKDKKKDNKKKTPALLAFFALYLTTIILISYLLTINSKTVVTNTSKKINLRYFKKF